MIRSCILSLLVLVTLSSGACSRKSTLTDHVNESFSLSLEGEMFDPFLVRDMLRKLNPPGTSREDVLQWIESEGFGSKDYQKFIVEQDGRICLYVFGESNSGVSVALSVVFEFNSSGLVEDVIAWIEL